MTQEEKAEAYSKAVENAKHEYGITTSEDRKQWLEELFPELKERDDERIRKEILDYIDKSTGCKRWVAWLEKQGQMIDNNRVEPKFKVGDWVMLDRPVLITKVEDMPYNTHQYWTSDGTWFGDATKAKLWTIKDAKDGDVLIDSLGNVCIYQEPSTKLMYHSHCYVNHKYFICMGGSHEIVGSYPATKEQRNQLEKAMADAGYVFDFEKKELKEIENEEYDGEDYGIDSLWHAKNILEKTLGKVDGYQSDDGILEHKCAISAVDKLYKQKPVWSLEDTFKVQRICKYLDAAKYYADSTEARECIDWLKSLKDRVSPQFKQEWSEEDKH